jgi:hypothetical protein
MVIDSSSIWRFFLVAVLGFISCGEETTEDPGDTYPYPEGHVTFQYLPMDLNQVHFYEPMGALDIFPKDHGGFMHKELNSSAATLPIYALTDGQITQIGERGVDYFIVVKYSTTISTKLGHVGQIADWVINKAGGIGDETYKDVFIPVEAGDTIGYVCSCSSLDLGVHDVSLELSYYYPELYGFEVRYAADPLNYYDATLRSQLANKIFRTGEPKGGKVDYDVKGKLIGNWYLKTKRPENIFVNHFVIAYDHIYSSRVSLADGYAKYVEKNDIGAFRYWVKGNAPKPEDIGVGVRVKYEGFVFVPWTFSGGTYHLRDISNVDTDDEILATYLMELTGPEELKVEMFFGKNASQVTDFTANARTYVRKPTWIEN